MVMVGPQCLGMIDKNVQIYFPIQDSHHDLVPPIKKTYFHKTRDLPNNHYKFHNTITQWLEQSYLADNKLQSFLALAKEIVANEHTLTRGLQGLLNDSIHQKGKHAYWVVVTHFYAHRQDLPFSVQDFQDFCVFCCTLFVICLRLYLYGCNSRMTTVVSMEILWHVIPTF